MIFIIMVKFDDRISGVVQAGRVHLSDISGQDLIFEDL
jgi:hypothetical protein